MRDRFPGVVPCRAGCDACCHGPFDISVADALEVGQALARLDARTRLGIETRARHQTERMAALGFPLTDPWDLTALGEEGFDAVGEALAGEPCPALDPDGRCLIYEGRPMLCRMMGLGMRTERGVLENACPIQDRFPAFRELAPQPFPLAAWETAEESARARAAERLFGDPVRAGYETTIAGAVLLAAR